MRRIRDDDGSRRLSQAAQPEHAVVPDLGVAVLHSGHQDGEQPTGQPARQPSAAGRAHESLEDFSDGPDREGAVCHRAGRLLESGRENGSRPERRHTSRAEPQRGSAG